MGVHVVRWLQCILLVTVALPATAGAQEVATTFERHPSCPRRHGEGA
jgi:hypothetical protein